MIPVAWYFPAWLVRLTNSIGRSNGRLLLRLGYETVASILGTQAKAGTLSLTLPLSQNIPSKEKPTTTCLKDTDSSVEGPTWKGTETLSSTAYKELKSANSSLSLKWILWPQLCLETNVARANNLQQ